MKIKELHPEQYRIGSISFETMMEEERSVPYMVEALMCQLEEDHDCIMAFVMYKLSEVKHE